MEIYRALSDFTPPDTEGSQNILSFQKGDKFEIFDCHKQTDWWGARSLKDNTIGYVPSKYLQHEERKIGKLIPAQEDLNEHKEKTLRRFADMQNQVNHRHPDDLNTDIAEPDPDYLDDDIPDAPPREAFPPPPPPLSLEEGDSSPHNGISYPVFPRPRSRPPSLTETESDDVLIRPKKLANPCVDSRERQALHRELLMNYKLGKDVLQKPELSKKLMDRRQTQKKKEWEDQKRTNNRTSFELKLEERATKLKETEDSMKSIAENAESKPELMRMHAKITHKQ